MGGKSQTSSQQVTIPPEVLARYNAVNANAQQVSQTPFQQYSSDPNAFVAPLTAAQNQGLQATSDYANAAQPGVQSAMGMTQGAMGAANPSDLNADAINKYMNPYTQNVTNQMTQLMNQQNQVAQSGQMGNAIKSGAFGGDRSGLAAMNLAGQQSLAYGNAMAPVLQQGYNTALSTAQQQQGVDLQAQQANLQRQMAGASQYGQLAGMGQQYGLAGAQALMGAGQVQQQTQQAGNTALYNQFLQQQSYPFQTAQFLANIAEGTGALSGQTTTSTQPSSFFSDRRLKENVKRIGTAKNGLPIHSFNYKDDPDKLTRLGFMADEVEKKHPEAVGLAGGYKTVDYGRAARASGGGTVTDFDHGRGFDLGGGIGSMYDPSWSGIDTKEANVLGHAGSAAAPGLDPYTAANRHVPKQSTAAPTHRMLTPGTMPQQQKSGLQQAAGLVQSGLGMYKDVKGMAGDAKSAYHDATGGGGEAPAAGHAAPAAGGSGDNPFSVKSAEPAAPAAPAAAAPAAPVHEGALETAAPETKVTELLPQDVPDVSGLAGAIPDVGFGARGGRIGRDMGGGLAASMPPPMMPETSQASMMQNEAKMRQSTPPTWNGPFAHGGLADGGQPAPVVTGAPTHGPDVVSPTADYLKGLGEAQEAQQRANDVQEKQHAVQQANPFMYSPDLSPFGQMMNARGLMQASQAQGQEGMYSPSYNGKPLGFVRGGLAGGGEGGGDVPYQDTGGLDIPDDKSWQQDKSEQKSMEPAPQKSGDSGGGGGAMGALGSIAGVIGKIAPLFMLAKGGGVQDGDEIPMGAVQREDDDDLPLLEREGGLLPKENAPLPPERPAGLGHALPDHFAEPDRFAPAGEHSRSMAPEGFTPNGPDNPLPEPFDRAKRFTLEDTHSRDMAPEGFTPNKPDNPLPEPFAAGLAGDRTAMADALRGDNSVAAMAPDNFTPGRPPSPLDRSELEGSPFAGYEKGLGADPLKADLQQNPPRVMPGLDPRVANRALNQEDIGGNPDQPGAKLPNRVPTPMPPGPVRADVNEPPRPLPPPDAGLVKKAAPAPVTPPVRPAAAGLNPSAPLQPHIVHTVPVAPQPARQIPGAMQPSYGANAYAPTPRIAPAQQAIEQGIPGARGRNVSPSSPATIHDYGGWQAPSVGQVFNRAAEIARQYGIDPHLFQRMIQQESGGLIDNIGDGRSSFGVIQAHFGGINPKMPHAGMGDDMRRAGIDVFDPSTWEKQLAFAANHIRNSGWSAWTTTMRKLGYNYASGGLVPPRRDEEA